MTHRIAVFGLDGAAAFDLGTPGQIFASARLADGTSPYQVRMCTADGQPIRTSGGFRAMPDYGPEILAEADTVIVPGIHGDFRTGASRLEPAEHAALSRVLPGTRLVSICTGAFALAAMGWLDHRPATTHWGHASEFRELFPLVKLDADVLFVDDGDVLTSAGVAAGIDLCLHLIRRDHGSDVANRAARRCVVPGWRDGGQAQFIERPLGRIDDLTTGPTRRWALQRLDEPVDLAALARHSRMSVRTFTRRFRDETGMSPSQWLTHHRVERARLLLETTDLGVDEVARKSGFRTTVSLRQHLHSVVGVAPLVYRRTFRPGVAAAPAP